jgi:CubicO group peptidase (beta-lactamase class C family)
MIPIDGICASQFDAVRDTFEQNFTNGRDVGASVALIVDGELVVDLWGGHLDVERTTPWQSDTLVHVHSITKTMVALCALILIDRGLIDPDAPVATYWPEFAANGKENILVRHLMSHTAGLPGWDHPVEVDDVYDWDLACAKLAAQPAWWPEGEASGYHLISYNHVVGELIHRVSGKRFEQFFADEITGPNNIDYHIGYSPEIADRFTPMIPDTTAGFDFTSIDPEGIAMRTFMGPFLGAAYGSLDYLSRSVPMNGIANARSIAQAQAVVSHGGTYNGRTLLSQSTLDTVFREQSNGIDLVLGIPTRFGIGYGLPLEDWPIKPDSTCWWAGMGGSRMINVLSKRATFAYAMNQSDNSGLIGDDRSMNLFVACMESLR